MEIHSGRPTLQTRPNIVVIVPDQLRPDFLGCYGAVGAATANIDDLARLGTRFDAAFSASPVCVPARTALLTGMNAISTGVLHNVHALRPDHRALGIVTWPERLSDAGYFTAAIGKLHLYPWDLRLGFNYRVTAEDKRWYAIRDDYYWYLRAHGITKHHARDYAGYESGLGAFTSPVPWELSVDHFVGDAARQFISTVADSEEPFALFVGFPSPHDPYDPVSEYLETIDPEHITAPIAGNPADGAAVKQKNIDSNRLPWCGIDYGALTGEAARHLRWHYAALVRQIDHEIGAIMDALKERQTLWENTAVIVTSDHGDYLGDHGMVGKESFFEGAIRIPLIVKVPGGAPDVSNSLVELRDVGALVLDLAGLAPGPLSDAIRLPGFGPDAQPSREMIFGALHDGWMVRTERWKLHRYATGEALLFDLVTDPHEMNNLVTDPGCRGVLGELDRALSCHVMASLEAGATDRLIAESDDLWNDEAFGREGWTRQYPHRSNGDPVGAPQSIP